MNKGEKTKTYIVNHAMKTASRLGLEGLRIGPLARNLGMSKSGLFGHFQSKEQLKLSVLKYSAELYKRKIIVPALKAEHGIARVRALFDNWLQWVKSSELPGGCIFIASLGELDDRPGTTKNFFVKTQREWTGTIQKLVDEAKERNELSKKADPTQFTQEVWGIILSFHLHQKLFKEKRAEEVAYESFERLLESNMNSVKLKRKLKNNA